MAEYFTFVFKISSKKYYCIWYSDEENGFITESNKVKCFNRMVQLLSYARNINLDIEDGETILVVDTAIKWLEERKSEIDCVYFLDYWNIISDLSHSVEEKFYGDEDKKILNQIYNKLFYGNNLSTINQEGEIFVPTWQSEEIEELAKVVKDGLRIIDIYLLS